MPASSARESILVIEDDEPISKIIVRLLQHTGYDVSAAMSAHEAFDAVDEHTPDLIVLDAHLPTVSGVEVCRVLRSRPATRHTLILFVTGDDTDEQRFEATAAGVDGFLAKPFHNDVLRDRIGALLASKHAATHSE